MSDFTFSCPACGQHISCDASNAGMSITCPACNTAITVPQVPPASPPAHASLSIAASQARHTASEAAHNAEIMSRTYAQSPGLATGGQKTSALAIASLVCSLTFCLGFIPGIICGHLARRNMRRDPSLKGAGLATAGLIIGYFTLAFSVGFLALGLTGFVNAFKKSYAEAKQKQEEMQAGHTSASASTTTNHSTASPASSDSLWTLNLMTAQFPDQPAAGRIHGRDFTVETAKAQGGVIALRQGQNAVADLQISIFYFPKPGETLAGKKYDLSPANSDLSPASMPHVHMSWKADDQSKNKPTVFRSGYAMKLELGQTNADGNIPAKIYLCLPDEEKSYVAGTFDLEIKNTPAKAKKTKKPAAN